jgi:hypothetical protein
MLHDGGGAVESTPDRLLCNYRAIDQCGETVEMWTCLVYSQARRPFLDPHCRVRTTQTCGRWLLGWIGARQSQHKGTPGHAAAMARVQGRFCALVMCS